MKSQKVKRVLYIDICIGIVGMMFTFAAAWNQNLLTTALFRSIQSFFLFCVLSFIARSLIQYIIRPIKVDAAQPDTKAKGNTDGTRNAVDQEKGQHIDFQTSEEASSSFTPLKPPHLKREEKMDPKSLADAVRTMSEQ